MKMNTDFNRNEDHARLLLSRLNEKIEKIKAGGGQKNADRQRELGKLLARERVAELIDPGSRFFEFGTLAADGMYEEYGGCPAAGVITGIGYVSGRQCVIVANDATVKAGAWFPMAGKKNLRAQEISIENHLPIIYLVDSAGVFLPMQDEIFPDKEHFGRIFRNNAVMSSMGIIQVAAVMGNCVAGGAYLPVMSDEAMIVDKTGSIFLAGSYLVKAAIGENIDNETLGGATTQSEISGVTDNKFKDDRAALKHIRNIFSMLGTREKAGFDRAEPKNPKLNPEEIFGIIPSDPSKQYDMHEVIHRIVDNSEFDEYKESYGQSIVCGYGRVEGWAVGIVANQRKVVKTKKGEMQFGGVIYSDSADKATRFIMNCNQRKIPLVFLQDVTGFMVGSRAEHGGIIKDGAKMVNAVANSVVPKFTVIIGNSYGAGNYAMCGKAYDPRIIVAWPTAQIAVMGGAQAANTLLQIQVSALKTKGKTITKEDEESLLKKITEKYNSQLSPHYAAARLWIDEIINPQDTRKIISMGIEAANHSPVTKAFNVGVIQT
jgi:acetyl-CoA carboxylase carboxyltransferase component